MAVLSVKELFFRTEYVFLQSVLTILQLIEASQNCSGSKSIFMPKFTFPRLVSRRSAVVDLPLLPLPCEEFMNGRCLTASNENGAVSVTVGGPEGTRKFASHHLNFECMLSGAIIGDGDRKRGVHAKPSKKTNVLFLAKIVPPSTS